MGLFKKHKTKYALTKIVNNPVYKLDSLYAAQQMDLSPIENKINELQKLLDNSIQTINNNFGEVNRLINNNQNSINNINSKIENLPKPIMYRGKDFDSGPYSFTQKTIGNNAFLIKIENLNFTLIDPFKNLKPYKYYYLDICLSKFKIKENGKWETVGKLLQRKRITTDGKGIGYVGDLGDYGEELCYFITTKKYTSTDQTFNVHAVSFTYFIVEEVWN